MCYAYTFNHCNVKHKTRQDFNVTCLRKIKHDCNVRKINHDCNVMRKINHDCNVIRKINHVFFMLKINHDCVVMRKVNNCSLNTQLQIFHAYLNKMPKN